MPVPRFTNQTLQRNDANGLYEWACMAFVPAALEVEVKVYVVVNTPDPLAIFHVDVEAQNAAGEWLFQQGSGDLPGDYRAVISPITGQPNSTFSGTIAHSGQALRYHAVADRPLTLTLADNL